MNFSYEKALNTVISKTSDWLETAIAMLPNLAVAIVIIVLFYFLARLSRYGIRQLNNRVNGNTNIIQLISNVVFAIILCIGIFIALSVLQLDKAVTSLLAGAGIIGLALGLAFQETASNFLAGVTMTFRKPFKIGDIIKTADYTGIVQELTLRATVVRTFQGEDVLIPNKTVYYNPIVNYSSYPMRRIDLKCRISFSDDLEKVRTVATEALQAVLSRDESREVKIWFEEFGESSIHFTAAVWVHYTNKGNYRDSVSDAVIKLKSALDKNDITIPFPIRTLDFNGTGGQFPEELAITRQKESAKRTEED